MQIQLLASQLLASQSASSQTLLGFLKDCTDFLNDLMDFLTDLTGSLQHCLAFYHFQIEGPPYRAHGPLQGPYQGPILCPIFHLWAALFSFKNNGFLLSGEGFAYASVCGGNAEHIPDKMAT